MAATRQGTAILMAALALPGVAQAENAPETASISIRHLDYKDSQPGFDRVHVKSPSLDLLVPIAGVWAVRAGLVTDEISGASPRYHTAVSGASRFKEYRKGADAAVTRYFPRASLTVAAGRSSEHDYVSRFASVQGTFASDDNNTTWMGGAGVSNDLINPVNDAVENERKRLVDFTAGVTQVLGAADIGQVVIGYVRGRGYFTNPYKFVDNRPREHDQRSVLLRWNHHFAGAGSTSRTSYRYYSDTYGVRAHTLQAEYVHPFGSWTFTPSLRLYTQSAADFYFDPVYDARFGPPFPPGFSFTDKQHRTADQRLSAYGAVTLGLKAALLIARDTTIDVKYEAYEQRGDWRKFGSGSGGLANFEARSIQLGITHRW